MKTFRDLKDGDKVYLYYNKLEELEIRKIESGEHYRKFTFTNGKWLEFESYNFCEVDTDFIDEDGEVFISTSQERLEEGMLNGL